MNIHIELKNLVKNERLNTVKILKLLGNLLKTKKFCELGHGTLYSYVEKELGFSADSAYRRINAAKILLKYPELENEISSGEITLSHLTKISPLLKQNNSLEFILSFRHLSNLETDKKLKTINPDKKKKEKAKIINDSEAEILTHLPQNVLEMLREIKIELNKETLSETISELVIRYKNKKASAVKVKKEEVLKGQISIEENIRSGAKRSRYIKAKVKRAVLENAQRQCEFVGKNGRRCQETMKLEYAHLKPFSHGGENSQVNLKIYCKGHNQFDAIKVFGQKKMTAYF
jgi:hypothetical protein